MSNFGKMFRERKHKWYLGLPKHMKLTFVVLHILFTGIVSNWYILLVLNTPCIEHYIALPIPLWWPVL